MLLQNPKIPLLSLLTVKHCQGPFSIYPTSDHMDEWADSAHILQEYIKLRTSKDGLKFKLLGV